jgi:hypothetical protein
MRAVYKRRTCGATQDLMSLDPQPHATFSGFTQLTAPAPYSPRLDKGARATAVAARYVRLGDELNELSLNGNSAAYGPD